MPIRFYFNDRSEAPLVASVDQGTSDSEQKVERVVCMVPTHTRYEEGANPCFWAEPINPNGCRLTIYKGTATIMRD